MLKCIGLYNLKPQHSTIRHLPQCENEKEKMSCVAENVDQPGFAHLLVLEF